MPPRRNAQADEAMMFELWKPERADDVARFVRFVYPWGEPNTPLQHFTGPRQWQQDEFNRLSQSIADNKERLRKGDPPKVFKLAVSSGRGPGKSAFEAMLAHWNISTHLGSTTIVTANTEPQLKTKTFAEIGKWFSMAINADWFEQQTLQIKPAPWFLAALKSQLKIDDKYYYVQGSLWSEESPDAFVGAHNPAGMMYLFDEASGIPSPIWTVTAGCFTEPVLHRYWFAFSQARRNSGGFYDVFHPKDDTTPSTWRTRCIDIRDMPPSESDPEFAKTMIATHGLDSDEVRVEVMGLFPKAGSNQFIPSDLVEDAQKREVVLDEFEPLIMGVDCARMGDDSTVIRWRQGRDARRIKPVRTRKMDDMAKADLVADWIDRTQPDAVCIDAGGGSGVIDRLRQMQYAVHEVWFASKPDSPEWADKRTEMYAKMRTWLKGSAIDSDKNLKTGLVAPEYSFPTKGGDAARLESKESMKNRGIRDFDDADALALTFAVKVSRKDSATSKQRRRNAIATGMDESVYT